jgi:hypothetical protein
MITTTPHRAAARHQAVTTAQPAGRLRRAWRRTRAVIREMNDASRRMVELQAPWIAGK